MLLLGGDVESNPGPRNDEAKCVAHQVKSLANRCYNTGYVLAGYTAIV